MALLLIVVLQVERLWLILMEVWVELAVYVFICVMWALAIFQNKEIAGDIRQ